MRPPHPQRQVGAGRLDADHVGARQALDEPGLQLAHLAPGGHRVGAVQKHRPHDEILELGERHARLRGGVRGRVEGQAPLFLRAQGGEFGARGKQPGRAGRVGGLGRFRRQDAQRAVHAAHVVEFALRHLVEYGVGGQRREVLVLPRIAQAHGGTRSGPQQGAAGGGHQGRGGGARAHQQPLAGLSGEAVVREQFGVAFGVVGEQRSHGSGGHEAEGTA